MYTVLIDAWYIAEKKVLIFELTVKYIIMYNITFTLSFAI